MCKTHDEMMASLPDDGRQRIERRAKRLIAFLKSEQALVRTDRGKNRWVYKRTAKKDR